MSSHFAKPENALRKGKDLVKVGKPGSALKTLHNILVARRYRLWSPTHEKIMFFYIELAVDLRRNVKDAFVQYRMICQQAQSGSMEKVMRYYQKLSEEKAAAAQLKAAAATAAIEAGKPAGEATSEVRDVEDLEEESPEAIMLAAMSGEGTKERLDRQILTPWVKYLWECYRTILDVLRNNAKLEVLYHHTARAAFDFCKRFGRNMEFRRLCEILRNHLFSVARFQNQANAVDLNSAETQTLYLETRFQQLKMAADLELWQEAYRTIEDIHENVRLGAGAKIEPPPELMKTYYEKLSQIFWASQNHLFHAYSLHKYYELSSAEATAAAGAPAAETSSAGTAPLSAEQRGSLASAVVLSSLIISGGQQSSDLHDIDAVAGVDHEGNVRLAQLLGFKKESPSRQRILQAVQASGVLNDASELSKNIFRLLETQFGPLTLYAQLKPLLAQLSTDPELSKYVGQLEQLTVIRVLQQLSTVFKSMKLAKLRTLVPDLGSVFALERLVLGAITSDLLQLRFDHRTGTLLFPESDLEHPKLRDQLVQLSRHFISMAHTLEGAAVAASPQAQADKVKERTHVFKLIQANLLEEHENVFLRQELIEKRKQELEKIHIDKEKRESEARLAALNARKAEEARRLQEEAVRREDERRRKEQAERDLRAKQQLAEEMKKKIDAVAAAANIVGKTQVKAEKKLESLIQDIENIDKIQLLRAQEEILKAQQREIERRRRETNRRIDYTVRAMRLEERAMLIARQETSREEEKEQMEADFAKHLEQDKLNHAKAVAEKERLSRMTREKAVFYEKLMARRQEAFAIEKAKQDERFAIKAEKRRIAEERRRAEEELRERERAIAAEKQRQLQLEEQRQEELRLEAVRQKELEKQEKIRAAKEAADKQIELAQARLKREDEAEAKEQARRAAARSESTTGPAGARDFARAGGERAGWGRPGAAGAEQSAERSSGDFRREEPRGGDFRREEPRGGDFRREEPRGGDFRRPDDRQDMRRGGDMPVRRDEREGGFRREERPSEGGAERDFGNLRNRPAPSEQAPQQGGGRFGDDRRRDDAPAGRWGANRDFPRDGPPRAGGFDRDAPRGGRFGGEDREPPSREAFGSRGPRDAPRGGGFERDAPRGAGGFDRDAPRGGGFDRDAARGADRGGNFRAGGGAGERDMRDFRRRDDAAPAAGGAPVQQQPAAPAPAAAQPQQQQQKPAEDDGFTTVRAPRR